MHYMSWAQWIPSWSGLQDDGPAICTCGMISGEAKITPVQRLTLPTSHQHSAGDSSYSMTTTLFLWFKALFLGNKKCLLQRHDFQKLGCLFPCPHPSFNLLLSSVHENIPTEDTDDLPMPHLDTMWVHIWLDPSTALDTTNPSQPQTLLWHHSLLVFLLSLQLLLSSLLFQLFHCVPLLSPSSCFSPFPSVPKLLSAAGDS